LSGAASPIRRMTFVNNLSDEEISTLWTDGNGEGVLDGEKDRRIIVPLVVRCPRDVAMCMFLFAPHLVINIIDDEREDQNWSLPPLASIEPGHIIARHLRQAILQGEVDCIALLLKTIRCGPWRGLGLDLSVADRYGSPLGTAAQAGSLQIFNIIRRFPGVIMYPDEHLIHTAAACGHIDIINELRSDVNLTKDDGRTPLHDAAASGQERSIRTLHNLGADVNMTDDDYYRTPLHDAAASDHERCIRALHELGADVNRADNMGQTPVFAALQNGWNDGCIRTLYELGADLNKTDNSGSTPLHRAVWSDETCIRTLLELGADVNKTDNNGQTPLRHAIRYRLVDSIAVLRALGAKE
jgi:ankyrin repeat protein